MSDNIYLNGSLAKYLRDLSAREMVPGGGSAAAVSAAVGAGLNLMVINYSTDKDESKQRPTEELIILKVKQAEILDRLQMLIDEDCRVFQGLMKALSSGEDPQGAYISAASVPLEVCRLCCESIELSSFLVSNSNKNLITDVSCAAQSIKAAFYSAELNVLINLKYIKDKGFIENTKYDIDKKRVQIDSIASEVEAKVREEISGTND